MEICSYWVAELDKGARMAEVAAPSLHYTREELVAREAWAPLATIAGIVAKNL